MFLIVVLIIAIACGVIVFGTEHVDGKLRFIKIDSDERFLDDIFPDMD